MKFEQYSLAPAIKENLASLGFKKPTDIQFKCIPPILKGEDVLAIAQTGTGKTAAFAIPIINKIDEVKIKGRRAGISCLVMVPTRELAIQISEVFNKLENHTKVKTISIFGGVEQEPQIAQLENGVDILVATPGRMFDLVSQGHIKFDKVKTLILDEADHMLDLGFIKDIQDVKKFLPRYHQTLFFSATITKKIKDVSYSLVRNPIRIQISPKDPVSKNVTHSVAFVEMDDKRFFLERLVNENEGAKILVFVRTKVRAERVLKAMTRVNIDALTIHGDKEQEAREAALNKFHNGEAKMLIATDVSARGIDIDGVNFVVNYDLPDLAENYVHRVGRTGRGRAKGLAVSFCSSEEKEMLKEIEEFMEVKISIADVAKSDYQETLDFTADTDNNWKALLKEAEMEVPKKRKKKKR